ncbi:restriction endonuclease subunit S [Candidatus Albibeggiatoa sp. nov. BB20]|uniref:restriction endonuclease subunit S n=1 Tax=Candidatus Albibeggiatoa sp. nov. BB20 TaxID=3162723 RepID=UPI0033655582
MHTLITQHLDIWTNAIKPKAGRGRGAGRKQELYGIKKLRGLILELAVRGLLVPQDPNDEPASVLLQRIAAEKSQLIKDKKLKKQKALPPITKDEKPFDLPEGWEWAHLGDITDYGYSEKAQAENVQAETWVLELEDVEKNTSKLLAKIRFKERNFKSSKNIFYKGNVIYGKLRPYLDKVIIADENGVCTTEMIPIKGYACLTSEFIRLAMKSPYFIEYANNSTHGMNLPRMGTEKARLALIPILPEKEQHRIVTKVDELMHLCDQLEQQTENQLDAHQTLVKTLLNTLTEASDHICFQAAWQRIAAHFDILFTTEHSIEQLKQTVLQLAVMGKLVPQDPNDEPASELLKKIAAEKAQLIKQKKIKKQKPLPPITEDEKPFDLPEGWELERFSKIVQEVATGPFGSMINKKEYINGGIPLINPSHMCDGEIVENNNISVSLEKAEELKSYSIFSDDIVMARRGEMGRCALVKKRENAWLCGTGSFVLRFYKKISRPFILILFRSHNVVSYLGEQSVGTTMTNLNHGILNKMPVALPPLQEQHRIVTKVDELMHLCDQLKTRLNDTQTTQLQLADTLLMRF